MQRIVSSRASRDVMCRRQGPRTIGLVLDPARYPWPVTARSGVLRPEGLEEAEAEHDRPGRLPVVAVGSNASPAVLRAKLGSLLETGMPLSIAEVDGLRVAHSAHVSARGYIAAAPAAGEGSTRVTVCWCDEPQLAAIDATEPNYRRVPLPATMRCREGLTTIEGVEVYASSHGVIGEHGVPLSLRPQAELLAWLRLRLPGVVDLLSHARLQEAGARDRVRRALAAAGLVVPARR